MRRHSHRVPRLPGCLFLAAISYRSADTFRRYSLYPPALLCDQLTRKPEQKDGIAKSPTLAETGRLLRLGVVGR